MLPQIFSVLINLFITYIEKNGKLREKVMSDQLTSLQRQLAQRDVLIRDLEHERHSSLSAVPPIQDIKKETINAPLIKKQDNAVFKKSIGFFFFLFCSIFSFLLLLIIVLFPHL